VPPFPVFLCRASPGLQPNEIDVLGLQDKADRMKKEIKDLQMTLVATSEKVQDLKKKVDVREL